MMTKSEAESRWCPFALVQSETKECSFSGEWADRNGGAYGLYKTDGKMVAVTVVNRAPDGSPNSDCLCMTTRCVFWRDFGDDKGDCSKLDDNMNWRSTEPDSEMEGQWCPNARPENEVVTGPWEGNGISGCTNAISSANRVSGNSPHPGSKCITSRCMAYSTNGSQGYCMDADKNMQR